VYIGAWLSIAADSILLGQAILIAGSWFCLPRSVRRNGCRMDDPQTVPNPTYYPVSLD
jgi:hypothetical protein